MSKVQYEEMFPWEVSQAIADAPVCYLPLGVLEWHGEHAAVGLDGIKAHTICVEAARRSGGVVVPTLWWGTDYREDADGGYLTGGIEKGERYHVPGSMFWIRPETHLNLMLDIYEAMRRRGFRAIIVLAGHWSRRGYLPTLRASGEQFLVNNPEMRWALFTDQELGSDLGYPEEHAAGGETSLLMAMRPDLVDLSATLETDGRLREFYLEDSKHLQRRRETENKYIGILRGVGDESNDPETTSSPERGEMLLEIIVERLVDRLDGLLAEMNDDPQE